MQLEVSPGVVFRFLSEPFGPLDLVIALIEENQISLPVIMGLMEMEETHKFRYTLIFICHNKDDSQGQYDIHTV